MLLIKILFVCLTILLGCIRESKSSVPNKDIGLNFDNEDNMNIFTKEECFCLPRSLKGKRVSEHATLDGEQARLVLYLYKNKNNKITVYVPNKKKQYRFPDLTLDDDDELDARNTERLPDLFFIYTEFAIPNNVKKSHPNNIFDGFPPSNTVYPSNPIENQEFNLPENYNTVQKPPKVLNSKEPRKTVLIKPGKQVNPQYQYPNLEDRYIIPPRIDNVIQYNPFISANIPNKKGDGIISGKPEDTHEIPNIPKHLPHYHYIPNVNGIPGHEVTYIPQSSDDHPNLIKVPITIPLENIPFIDNPLQEGTGYLMPESQRDKIKLLNRPFMVKPHQNFHRPLHQQPGYQTPSFNDVNVNPFLLKDYQFNTDKFSLSPQKDIFLTPYKEYPYQQNIVPGKGFEQWFRKQIALLRQNRHSKSQDIDETELRTFILHALHKNGININKKGKLVDSNGVFLDLNNLQLRPILLGDPKEYHKLVATQKCIIPHKLPYLEAVLVTLTYPPKILGIVPLGKTLKQIPQETKQLCSSGTCGNKHICKGTQCNKNKAQVNIPHKNKVQQNKVQQHKVQPNRVTKPKVTTQKATTQRVTKQKITIATTAKPKYRPPKSKVLLGTLKSGLRRSDDGIRGIIFDDRLSPVDTGLPPDLEGNVIKLDDDEDSVGTRIIGGHSALSSGVIVKNRGRSGQIDD